MTIYVVLNVEEDQTKVEYAGIFTDEAEWIAQKIKEENGDASVVIVEKWRDGEKKSSETYF